jgi:hypothetical protein
LIDKPQTIAPHRFDSFPDGEVAHCRVLWHRFVNDVANAKFVKHARHEAKMIEAVTPVGLFHVLSSQEEILPTPKITQIPSRVCGMSALCAVASHQSDVWGRDPHRGQCTQGRAVLPDVSRHGHQRATTYTGMEATSLD